LTTRKSEPKVRAAILQGQG